MAASDLTVTGTLTDALGTAYDYTRTKMWLTFNTENGRVTDDEGVVRLDAGTATVNSDGTFTMSGIPCPGASNPVTFQVKIHFDAPPRLPGPRDVKRFVGDFGWMTITEDAAIQDLEDEQAIPAEYQTAFTEAAQAYLDAQAEIAGIDDTDSAVAGLIEDSLVGVETVPALIEFPKAIRAAETARPRASVGFDDLNDFVTDGTEDYTQLQAAAALGAGSETGVDITVGPGEFDMSDVLDSAVPLPSYSTIRGAGPASRLVNTVTHPSESDVDGWGMIRVPHGSQHVDVGHLAFVGVGAPDASHTNVSGASVTLEGTELAPIHHARVHDLNIVDGMHGVDVRRSQQVDVDRIDVTNCQHPVYVYDSKGVAVRGLKSRLELLSPETMLQRHIFVSNSKDVSISDCEGLNSFTCQLFLRSNPHYVGAGRSGVDGVTITNFRGRNDRSTLAGGTSVGIQNGVRDSAGLLIMVNPITGENGVSNVTVFGGGFHTDGGHALSGEYLLDGGDVIDASLLPRIKHLTFVGVDFTQLSGDANSYLISFLAVSGLSGYAYQDIKFLACKMDSNCGSQFKSVDSLKIAFCDISTAGVRGDTNGRPLTFENVRNLDLAYNKIHSEDAPVALRVLDGCSGRIVGNTITKGSVDINTTFLGENQYATQTASLGVYAPSWPLGGINGSRQLLANISYGMRFTVARQMTAAVVRFNVDIAATADDSVDISIHEAATGTKIASTGSTTGKLNSTGRKSINLAASVVLYPDRAYYAAMTTGTLGGTAASVSASSVAAVANTPVANLMGTTMPYLEAGFVAATGGVAATTLVLAQTTSTHGSALPIIAICSS